MLFLQTDNEMAGHRKMCWCHYKASAMVEQAKTLLQTATLNRFINTTLKRQKELTKTCNTSKTIINAGKEEYLNHNAVSWEYCCQHWVENIMKRIIPRDNSTNYTKGIKLHLGCLVKHWSSTWPIRYLMMIILLETFGLLIIQADKTWWNNKLFGSSYSLDVASNKMSINDVITTSTCQRRHLHISHQNQQEYIATTTQLQLLWDCFLS